MKQFLTLIALLLILACGTSKKAIEKAEDKKEKIEPEVEIKKDIDVMVKEDIAIKDIDPRVVATDTITKTNIESMPDKVKDGIEATVETSVETSKDSYRHTAFNKILETHVSVDGNVNYVGIKNDRKELNSYIKSLATNLPEDGWSKNEKLAYWINAYNALTIDLILRNYPLNSIKDIKDPWDQRLWKFGEKWINLNQIEHEILREMDEPRIHFAIVCASFSCPKLQNTAFTASNLDTQLTNATKEFLTDSKRNKISENRLELSKIFRWFSKDFETEGSLIDFLNKYTEAEISSKAKKSFLDYNWDLNK